MISGMAINPPPTSTPPGRDLCAPLTGRLYRPRLLSWYFSHGIENGSSSSDVSFEIVKQDFSQHAPHWRALQDPHAREPDPDGGNLAPSAIQGQVLFREERDLLRGGVPFTCKMVDGLLPGSLLPRGGQPLMPGESLEKEGGWLQAGRRRTARPRSMARGWRSW